MKRYLQINVTCKFLKVVSHINFRGHSLKCASVYPLLLKVAPRMMCTKDGSNHFEHQLTDKWRRGKTYSLQRDALPVKSQRLFPSFCGLHKRSLQTSFPRAPKSFSLGVVLLKFPLCLKRKTHKVSRSQTLGKQTVDDRYSTNARWKLNSVIWLNASQSIEQTAHVHLFRTLTHTYTRTHTDTLPKKFLLLRVKALDVITSRVILSFPSSTTRQSWET